jgi:hypothetical protein
MGAVMRFGAVTLAGVVIELWFISSVIEAIVSVQKNPSFMKLLKHPMRFRRILTQHRGIPAGSAPVNLSLQDFSGRGPFLAVIGESNRRPGGNSAVLIVNQQWYE